MEKTLHINLACVWKQSNPGNSLFSHFLSSWALHALSVAGLASYPLHTNIFEAELLVSISASPPVSAYRCC